MAKATFDAGAADDDRVVSKLKNKVMSAVGEMLPDAVTAGLHRPIAKPGSAG